MPGSVAFTPNQREALATDRHLSVTANAGSGKTTVLVHRFVEILRTTDCSITELVAITFTEKAAGELRSRIARKIEEAIVESSSPVERARMLRARDKFASAQIHTIHAFCARLLREYPVEADIDAGFTVLEEVDASLMLDQSIREMFEQSLSHTGSEDGADLLSAVRMLGGSTVEEYLSRFVRSRDLIDRLNTHPGIFSSDTSPEDIADFWKDEILRYLIKRLDREEWRSALRSVLMAAKGKSAGSLINELDGWHASLGSDRKISLYVSLRSGVLTGKGELRIAVSGKADVASFEPGLRLFRNVDREIGELAVAYADPVAHEGNNILARILRTLFRCCAIVLVKYAQNKLEMGKLDFQDLQVKVRDLLARPDIRQEVARRIRFIMVDEYQDTDVLQYEILKALIPAEGSPYLYVVGDPKQSIYSFRHADVRMFHRTQEDIATLNGGEKAGSKSAIVLPESFRLLADNVAFVNRVFSWTMNDDRDGGGVAYDELVRGRANDAPGGVELMLVPGGTMTEEEDENKEDADSVTISAGEAIRMECAMIATRLLQLKREGTTVFELMNNAEVAAPFEFRHAAILLRGRTHLTLLESALEALHIPYVVNGGIGYYQTQEVTDFHNYFRFLLDPSDDVALVALLRSPFFIVSDAELFMISGQNVDGSFWDKTQRYAASPEATDSVRRGVKVLQRHLLAANRVPVPVLVQNMFRETGWHATMAGLAFGSQRIANVRKLVRFAREFESKGLTNLYDVVARLSLLMQQEMKEGQASVDTRQNCVNILTVHGAKGLEFPVVFLPFLHTALKADSPPFLDADIGIGFGVANPRRLDDAITPLLQTYLAGRARRRREAEEKRVFYVACTRARDLLICSGMEPRKRTTSSPLNWMLDACGCDPGLPVREDIFLPVASMKILSADGSASVKDYGLRIRVRVFSGTEESGPRPVADEFNHSAEVRFAIGPLESRSKGEVYSATQIGTYLECPARFYLKYRLGLAEEHSTPSLFDENSDPDDSLPGNIEGSIIHAVLQQFITGFPPAEAVRAAIRRQVISTTGGLTSVLEDDVEAMFKLVDSFRTSPARAMIESASEVKTEFTVTSCFDDDFVTGTLDLVCLLADGSYRIIDYKTDRITAKTASERVAHYRSQLLFYALLIRRLHGNVKVVGELIFLRNPGYSASFEFGAVELKDFERRIRESIENMRKGVFGMDTSECGNCGYVVGGKCPLAVS